jgi:hypothetical protein
MNGFILLFRLLEFVVAPLLLVELDDGKNAGNAEPTSIKNEDARWDPV